MSSGSNDDNAISFTAKLISAATGVSSMKQSDKAAAQESDTPRTGKLKIPSELLLLLGKGGVPEKIVQAILALGDHARQLERELGAAQTERDQYLVDWRNATVALTERAENAERELAARLDENAWQMKLALCFIAAACILGLMMT